MVISVDSPPNRVKANGCTHRMARATAVKGYRQHAKEQAMAAAYDLEVLEPYRNPAVYITYYHKNKSFFCDSDNALYALKSVFDGFQDAGIWVNDRACTYYPVQQLVDRDNPRVEIRIEELGQ